MTTNDWDLNPHLYRKNKDGSFILRKDGTPSLKGGRPKKKEGEEKHQYNFHSKTKAQLAVRRERANLRRAENKAKALKEKAVKHEQAIKAKRKEKEAIYNRLDGADKKRGNVLSEDELINVPPEVREALHNEEIEVVFRPNEGPQTEFLSAPELDILYGGAAGGGKSYAMLVDPLRYAHRSAHRALIVRRSMGELRELIDKSRDLYPKAFPGARFRDKDKIWTFPSGAKLEFSYLERDADVYRYQGVSYSWIGVDELTQWPTEFPWNYLSSRLRTTDPEITTYLRATANPGGVGSSWVKKRYIEPAEPGRPFKVQLDGGRTITRRFIPARLTDNPYLTHDGQYESMLQNLPPILRRQLLEGNWDVIEGAAFPEFDLDVHVIPPFEIPLHWERFKAIDYGYTNPTCCIWFAVDPEDGTLIVYRELYKKGLDGEPLARLMFEMEHNDAFYIPGVLDNQAWATTGMGYKGPTVGEVLVKMGHKLRRADKNRKAGKIQLHERLRRRPGGKPGILFFSTTVNAIKTFQALPLSKTDTEDVDTHAEDHAYDACRYGVMSRPRIHGPMYRMMNYEQSYEPVDKDFGW